MFVSENWVVDHKNTTYWQWWAQRPKIISLVIWKSSPNMNSLSHHSIELLKVNRAIAKTCKLSKMVSYNYQNSTKTINHEKNIQNIQFMNIWNLTTHIQIWQNISIIYSSIGSTRQCSNRNAQFDRRMGMYFFNDCWIVLTFTLRLKMKFWSS